MLGRAEIRDFFFHDPNRKPSQKEIIQWFENEHYHTLTQGQSVKDSVPSIFFLDGDGCSLLRAADRYAYISLWKHCLFCNQEVGSSSLPERFFFLA
jgi:hypothetical protein